MFNWEFIQFEANPHQLWHIISHLSSNDDSAKFGDSYSCLQ
jgi:hypothetical protein